VRTWRGGAGFDPRAGGPDGRAPDGRGGPDGQRGPDGRGPDGRGPDGRGFDDRGRPGGGVGGPGRADGYRADGYRPGGRGGFHGNGGGDWNRGWRGDRRYDWQGYRATHRDLYRVDRYRPPYGYDYGYRRFGIGMALGAGFFAEQYWIADPSSYDLPPAYGPYRWVRYYNDALLVNVYNGMIVDEIPDFFW
jgi:Ni/Co efflux regulator RcnB